MKKVLMIALFFTLACVAYSQDSNELLLTYERNFARASIGTKLQLLQEAATYEDANLGELYDTAIRFVIDNSDLLKTDSIMREIAIFSVQMIGKTKYVKAIDNLWRLFQMYRENTVRVPILYVLGEIGASVPGLADKLNTFLANQNSIYKAGTVPDLAVVDACILALGKLGDGSSFPVIFSAMTTQYSEQITQHAEESLALIKGDYKQNIIAVIMNSPMTEKYLALSVAIKNAKLQSSELGEIAEEGLNAGLSFTGSDPNEQTTSRELRFLAVRQLTVIKWSKASPAMIKNFNLVRSEYMRGIVSKNILMEAIAGLGAMGTTEAATALAEYLKDINTLTEQGKTTDESIVLAVINNLGLLGDKVAFDYLFYVKVLRYSDSVKNAATDALKKLKW